MQQPPGRCFCKHVSVSGWIQGGCTWHWSHGRCWCWSFPLSLPFTVISASQGHLQSTFPPEAFAFAALNIKGAWGGREVLKLGTRRQGGRDHHCDHHPAVWQCICLILPAGFLTKAYLGSKPEVFFGDLAPMPAALGGGTPLPQLCLLSPFVLSFLKRPFRVVFNLQQSHRLDVFLCGFQMIRKKESQKES